MEILTIIHLVLIAIEALNLLTTFSIKIKIKMKAKKPQKMLDKAQKKMELAKKIIDKYSNHDTKK